jgi:hypothetical protein
MRFALAAAAAAVAAAALSADAAFAPQRARLGRPEPWSSWNLGRARARTAL